ncbi:MAG: Holdfast attachment protein [Pseudomonadota bacterium]|jgi:ATP-binding cassette subfamily F protein uup
MSTLLLSLKDIHLTFGGTPLLEGAELAVAGGDKICLVGRNGSGKSTLMKIAAGMVAADRGEVFRHPDARIEYLPQEVDFTGFETALEYVEAGLPPTETRHRAQRMLEKLGLAGSEDVRHLSGGEARRTAIARALAAMADVLLLDEPTNHLDLPAIEWLESELASTKSAIVLISHDRRFLEKLSRQTVWLDRGKSRVNPRGFAAFEEWRDAILEQEEAERHKLDRKIAREEEWMYGGGVTARRRRNMRRVGELADMRQARREARKAVGNVAMAASEAGMSGKRVILAERISKDFGAGPVVRDFSIKIDRGDRVGIVGPNGAGKTTLLEMLTGRLEPDSGSVGLGTNLEMITLDQTREVLRPEDSVAETITRGHGDWVEVAGHKRHVASYLKDFLFLPEQTRSPVKVLSGGERARLLLARALATPSNLMVLDEPTNDLDMETLDLLQELIAEYAGTLLLVSHDRDFLDRTATSIIAYEGDGSWVEYAGGYTDMLAQRGAARVPAAAKGSGKKTPATASGGTQGGSQATKQVQQKRKLSFKEKHALETLPARLTALAEEIATLEARIADPALYAKDPARFAEATEALGQRQMELQAAEEQWLELEILREELEGTAKSG